VTFIVAANTLSTEIRAPHPAQEKWGVALNAGFQLVPDALIKHQDRLGLSPTDLVVLLNLMSSWWYRERLPFIASRTIAKRVGVSPRTVQRSIALLKEKNLIRSVSVRTDSGEERTGYDLDGLVEVLKNLAKSDPAFRDRIALAPLGRLEG
jgi:predicted transcriptional regulator